MLQMGGGAMDRVHQDVWRRPSGPQDVLQTAGQQRQEPQTAPETVQAPTQTRHQAALQHAGMPFSAVARQVGQLSLREGWGGVAEGRGRGLGEEGGVSSSLTIKVGKEGL